MKSTLFIGLILSTASIAGTMTVKGVSNIGQAPDYLELKVSTLGKCFKTAQESNAAAEQSILRLKEIVENHIEKEIGDQLILTAGQSARQRETQTILNSQTNRNETSVVCEKGWRSSRELIAKFANLNAFEEMNPKLLEVIDDIELESRVNEKGVVAATVHAPIPRLMPETTSALEENALKESLINASKQFQIVKSLCDLVNVSIKEIGKASSVVRPYRDGTDPTETSEGLNFALQYVHLAYNITFSFENTSGECAVDSLL